MTAEPSSHHGSSPRAVSLWRTGSPGRGLPGPSRTPGPTRRTGVPAGVALVARPVLTTPRNDCAVVPPVRGARRRPAARACARAPAVAGPSSPARSLRRPRAAPRPGLATAASSSATGTTISASPSSRASSAATVRVVRHSSKALGSPTSSTSGLVPVRSGTKISTLPSCTVSRRRRARGCRN